MNRPELILQLWWRTGKRDACRLSLLQVQLEVNQRKHNDSTYNEMNIHEVSTFSYTSKWIYEERETANAGSLIAHLPSIHDKC